MNQSDANRLRLHALEVASFTMFDIMKGRSRPVLFEELQREFLWLIQVYQPSVEFGEELRAALWDMAGLFNE